MSVRTTRGIEPGTSISWAHSSGTWPKPSRRAATAGNSASRSGVSVKIALTTRSGVSSLRVRISRTSSSVAARIASRSFFSTVAAPRRAWRGTAREGASRPAPCPPGVRLLPPLALDDLHRERLGAVAGALVVARPLRVERPRPGHPPAGGDPAVRGDLDGLARPTAALRVAHRDDHDLAPLGRREPHRDGDRRGLGERLLPGGEAQRRGRSGLPAARRREEPRQAGEGVAALGRRREQPAAADALVTEHLRVPRGAAVVRAQ